MGVDVRARWRAAGGTDEAFDDVERRYGEPHRAYHTLAHIKGVVATIDELGAGDDPAVVLAAILHDVIYDPTRNDNEAESAVYARRVLAHLDGTTVDRVAALIEATASHTGPPGDAGLDALLDADLAPLGSDENERYADAIRTEYSFVPEQAYAIGRRAVLQGFLDRPRLYRTDVMHERLDAKARANLRMEIEKTERVSPSPSS